MTSRVRCSAEVHPLQNTPLQVHTYNVLLHLCSGGNQQGEAATRVHPAESNEVRYARLTRLAMQPCMHAVL